MTQPTGLDERRAPALEPRVTLPAFAFTWLAAAVASAVPLIVFADPDEATPIPVLAASLIAGWVVYLLGVAMTSRAYGTGDARSDFSISFRPGDLIGVPIGVASQLALIPLVYLPLQAVWPDTFDEQALSETAEDLIDRADGASLVLLFALVVVGAPLVEEIVYRGLLQRPLLGRFATPAVLVGVAALFAVIHFRPIEYPGLFVAGLVFGVCAWRSGRLGLAIVAHAAFNATGLAFAL
ncbi:MAG: lysostaphin resistance A-like protein [Ilumatobacter sp.]